MMMAKVQRGTRILLLVLFVFATKFVFAAANETASNNCVPNPDYQTAVNAIGVGEDPAQPCVQEPTDKTRMSVTSPVQAKDSEFCQACFEAYLDKNGGHSNIVVNAADGGSGSGTAVPAKSADGVKKH